MVAWRLPDCRSWCEGENQEWARGRKMGKRSLTQRETVEPAEARKRVGGAVVILGDE